MARINAGGTALLYATYLGGSSGDEGRAIAVDAFGNAYVTGWTDSSDFPSTSSLPYAGNRDAFASKINSVGNSLLFSTYLGGTAGDQGNGIAVDSLGTAYMTGSSASAGFQVTDSSTNSGGKDVFVARIGSLVDLSIVLNDNDQVPLGGTLIYTATVTNNGPDGASGVSLVLTLPAGVTYLNNDSGCTPDGVAGTVTCSLGSLASGASDSVQVQVSLDTASTVTASVTVTANEFDYPAANNTDSEDSTASQADAGTPSDSQNTTNPNDPTNNPPFINITDPGSSSGGRGGGGGSFHPFEIIVAALLSMFIPGRRRRLRK